MNPTISVIMATYNGQDYVLEQLESIRNQTTEIQQVLIYDDHSSDKTAELIELYIVQHQLSEQWKLHVNTVNLGYADNFHQGFNMATGEYIFFADQDDIWLPDRVKQMCDIMRQNENLKVLATEFSPFYMDDLKNGENKTVVTNRLTKELKHLQSTQQSIFLQAPGCAMATKRSFVKTIMPYWYSGFAQDEYLWKMAWCAEGLYYYYDTTMKRRYHNRNASMNKMRTYQKRLVYAENLQQSYQSMQHFLQAMEKPALANIIKHNQKAAQYRCDMLKTRQLWNVLPLLLKYNDTFQTPKSVLVEGYYSICKK